MLLQLLGFCQSFTLSASLSNFFPKSQTGEEFIICCYNFWVFARVSL